MLLVRALPARMRAKAVGNLCLDPPQPSIVRYAALHSWVVARIAAEENLELFELLDPDTTPPVLPSPHGTATTNTPVAPVATGTPAAPTATSLPTAFADNKPPNAPAATGLSAKTMATTATDTHPAPAATEAAAAAAPAALPIVSLVGHRVANFMLLLPVRRHRFVPSPGHH